MSWFEIIAPAWLAGSLLVLLSAPLGCLVLWRRMAFFSDTLAHGALLGVAIAAVFELPANFGMALVSLLVVMILSALQHQKLPSDAMLAALASSLLCVGLLTLTHLTQQQANVLGFLFGNLLDIGWQDLPKLATLIAIGIVGLYLLWDKQVWLATSHDMAKIHGIHERREHFLFMMLLAGFCAVALQAVGSLLISGLLILPALSARLFAHSPKMMVLLAIIIGEIGVSTGVWGSVWLDTQTGLSIVLILAIIFFVGFFVHKFLSFKFSKKNIMTTFTLACLSDLHLQGAIGQDISFLNFEQVLNLALTDQPDFLLFTGDLVNGGDTRTYDYLINHLTKTGIPFALMIGNHDVTIETTPKAHQTPDLPYHYRTFGEMTTDPRLIHRKLYDFGIWQLICLNTAIAGHEHGHVCQEDLVWLDQTLQASNSPTLLAMHHHPIAVQSQWIDALMLNNSDALLEVLARHPNCRTLVSGHVHQAHTLQATINQRTITLMTNPACSRQFLPFSADFALDDQPAGYRLLRLHSSGDFESEVKRLPKS